MKKEEKKLPLFLITFNIAITSILIISLIIPKSYLSLGNNSFTLILFEIFSIVVLLSNFQSTKKTGKKIINKKVNILLVLLLIPAIVLAYLITKNINATLMFFFFFLASSSIKFAYYEGLSKSQSIEIFHDHITAFGTSLMIAIIISGLVTGIIGDSLTLILWAIVYFIFQIFLVFEDAKKFRKIMVLLFIIILILNIILLSSTTFINYTDTIPKYTFEIKDHLKSCESYTSVQDKDLCIYSISLFSRATNIMICENIISIEFKDKCIENINNNNNEY